MRQLLVLHNVFLGLLKCLWGREESDDGAALRILGLRTETVAQVEAVRRQLVTESEILYAGDDSDNGDGDDNLEDEFSEEESW